MCLESSSCDPEHSEMSEERQFSQLAKTEGYEDSWVGFGDNRYLGTVQ